MFLTLCYNLLQVVVVKEIFKLKYYIIRLYFEGGKNMQNRLVRKGLVLGIIVLFVGASVIPSMGGTIVERHVSQDNKTPFKTFTTRGNILCVGGSGEGNYTSIQDAIDNASDGDTVFVYDYSSPYYENLIVNKSINLIGEDRDTTVIDGSGSGCVIYVSADEVSIDGFTVQNGGVPSNGNDINSHYNNIANHNIADSLGGVWLDSSKNNITGNTISNNAGALWLNESSNNTITGNIISSNKGFGIMLDFSSSNTITGNNISTSLYGVYLATATSNTITGNTIDSNINYGILLVFSSDNNIIYQNNFINNTINAVVDECGKSTWDDGKYGNYWDDYRERYPDAKESKWIPGTWNTPYTIGSEEDNHPLINQWPNSRPRTITRATSTYNANLLRFIDMFLILQRLLDFIK